MDPATAIGVASSVLAFLDFSIKVANGAVEIYHSVEGMTSENAHLENVARDMKSRAKSLKQDTVARTEEEKSIVELAEECYRISDRMMGLLKETKVKGGRHSKFGSLKAAFVGKRKEKDVAELKSQLQEYRAQILLNLQLVLQDDQSTIILHLQDIKKECTGMKTTFAAEIDTMRTEVLRVITTSQCTVHEGDSSGEFSLGIISKKLTEIQLAVADVPIHHRILRHLVFDSMSTRRNQIHAAEPDTCRWILDDDFVDASMEDLRLKELDMQNWNPYLAKQKQSRIITVEKSDRKRTRQQVLAWLQAGDSIFHISGNAGSGKSTLMKFIQNHSRTEEELLIWAGSKKLLIGHYFFWSPGNTLQRTLAGLYKSLLFQILSRCPELIEHVFPSQLARIKESRGSREVEAVEDFSDNHIREAFDLLITRTSFNRHRFCFFIDGLDECDGSRLDHERLAARLKSWTTGGDVKLCVSSRPWAEFSKAFDSMNSLTLHLHLLNRFDIETYCIGQLIKDDEAGQDPDLCRRLAETIVGISAGIFLWAHLVTDVVLQGIRQGDPADVLMAKIKEMPHQLKDLYKKLREPVEKSKLDKMRSNRMLLLAARRETHIMPDMNAMAFSWLYNADGQLGLLDLAFPPASEYQPYSEDEIATRLKRVSQQVNGLARGFLELVTADSDHPAKYQGLVKSFWSTRIQFCHRSAHDYLLEEIDDTLNLSFPNFDSVYERIYIAELIYGKNTDVPFDHGTFWDINCPSGFRDAGTEILGRLEATLRPELRPRWHNEQYVEMIPKKEPVSFLHYVASLGCYQFVRARLEFEPDRSACNPASINLVGQESKTSLFVAALSCLAGSQDLPIALLHRRIELDILVNAVSDGVPTKLPAWLIAYVLAAELLLPRVRLRRTTNQEQARGLLQFLGGLHTYSLETGQPLTLKVGVLTPRLATDHAEQTGSDQHTFGGADPDLPYQVFTIESNDFIRLMSPSEDALAGHKLPLLPWLAGLSAQDFLSHANERRWHEDHVSPIFDDPSYDEYAWPFALLAVDWGTNHIVLRKPTQAQSYYTYDLLNYRIY